MDLCPETLLEDFGGIPPAVHLLPTLHDLLGNPDVAVNDIAAVVRTDIGLAAAVVRTANSILFSANGVRSSSIEESLHRIGFDEAYRLVGVLVTQTLFEEPLLAYNLEQAQLWEQSILTATCMAALCGHAQTPAGTAYTIGLLHSVGKIVLNRYALHHGLPGSDASVQALNPFLERQLLGFTDADVAKALLRHWHFPACVLAPIALQYTPDQAGIHTPTAALTALCRHAARCIQHHPSLAIRPAYDRQCLNLIGLDADTLSDAAISAYFQTRRLIACAA